MWHLICLSSAVTCCVYSTKGFNPRRNLQHPQGNINSTNHGSLPLSLKCPIPHLLCFEQPFAGPVVFDFVPPSEPDQEPTRHVLDGPEVEGQEDNDRYEQLHERVREEEGEDQVHHQRRGAKKDVKESGYRMPV